MTCRVLRTHTRIKPTALARHIVFILLLSSASSIAFAQALQTPGSEEQRRRSQSEEQERRRQLQAPNVDLQSAVPKTAADTPTTLPTELPCFPIERLELDVPDQLPLSIRLAGASTLLLDPFHFAQEYLDRYTGTCIGKRGLNLIIQRLTQIILAHGYSTTRLGIPEQDLSGGVLNLTLVPGVIRAIRFSDPDLYGTWRNAFPADAGDLLNLRDLEQGLEQMKRIPSQDVDMQIVPGDVPGQSDIIISVKRAKPWKIVANLDDSGAKGTGQWQSGFSFALDNPLGLSDMLNIGISSDADRRGAQRGTDGSNIYYAIPWGYWNFSVSAGKYSYHQRIGNKVPVTSSGESRNFDVDVTDLFQRDRSQKNSLQFKIGKRWNSAYINDFEMDSQKRDTTFAQMAWMHKQYFGTAQLDITLANRWGVSWFNGQGDDGPRMASSPTYRYSLQSIDATLVSPFHIADQPLTYIGTLRGQTTHSRLYLSEQISIGNRYTVRGFDGELTLASERGFFMRNELNMPLARSAQSAYLGIDFGKVYGQSVKDLIGDKLAGATVGLRGGWGGMTYDIFNSWPLYKPKQLHTATPAVGIRLTYQY